MAWFKELSIGWGHAVASFAAGRAARVKLISMGGKTTQRGQPVASIFLTPGRQEPQGRPRMSVNFELPNTV